MNMSSLSTGRLSYPNISTRHTRISNGVVIFAKENIWLNGYKVQISGDFKDVARILNRHSTKTGVKAEVVFNNNLVRLKLIVRGTHSNLMINDPKGVFRSLQMGKNIGTGDDMLVQIICKGRITWSYNYPTTTYLALLSLVSAENIKILNTYRQQVRAEAVVTPTEAVVTPTEAVVTPTEAVVTPTEAVVTPAEAVVTPTEAVVTPAEAIVTPMEADLLSPSSSLPPRKTKIMIKPLTEPIVEAVRKHKSILGSGKARLDFVSQLNWLKSHDTEFMSSHATKVSWSPSEKARLLARYRQVQSLS